MTSIEPPSTPPIPATRIPRLLSGALLACIVPLGLSACGGSQQTTPVAAAATAWRLAWSDEFNAPAGASPDPAHWAFDIGGNGFGNHELETYTSRPANAQQGSGNLVITALQEDLTGPDGTPRHYTSARLRTQGKFTQAYGRFEAHMQLPTGKGIWPAFWLLGDDTDTNPWPACGEIDIMEAIGDPSTIYSTLHGPGYSGAHGLSAKFPLPAGNAIDTAFHLYAVEWSPNDIKFFFDGHLIAEHTPADLPAGAHWAYDHPFFIILNLAVGGDWPGSPDASTTFPQRMIVDYVRVYTRDAPAASALRSGKAR